MSLPYDPTSKELGHDSSILTKKSKSPRVVILKWEAISGDIFGCHRRGGRELP